MTLGPVRRKVGMTRVFDEQDTSIPVTVLDMFANRVAQVKSKDTDDYTAIQVTFDQKKVNRVNKAEADHFAKAGVEAGRDLIEFALTEKKLAESRAGDETTVPMLRVGQLMDVIGISRGKGFSSTIRRHGFGAQRTSHGNSHSHRVPGSTDMAQDPGQVFPGKRMASQYGNTKATVQKLETVHVDAERQLSLVKGAVPDPVNSDVVARPSMKAGA